MKNEFTHADIVRRLERIEEVLRPINATWQELATRGRLFGIAGRSVLWTAGLVISVMGAYTLINGAIA